MISINEHPVRDFEFVTFPPNNPIVSLKIRFKEFDLCFQLTKKNIGQLKAIINCGFPEL
jgi:hypothetical protein